MAMANPNWHGGFEVKSETERFTVVCNRAVYTRENKPRLTLAAAYIRREHPV